MGAAAYMAHISKNECDVIKSEDFDRLRAEKQLKKDEWEAALDTQNVMYGDSARFASEANTDGGAQLMDEDPRTSTGQPSASGLDSGISPLQPTTDPLRPSTDKLSSSMANLSVDRFPPLSAQPKTAKKEDIPPKPTVTKGDLLEFEEEVETKSTPAQPEQKSGVWTSSTTALRRLFPTKEDKAKEYPSQSDLSGFPSRMSRTTLTGATYGNDTYLPGSGAATDRDPIPGAARPVNNDPNAPHAGVKTATRMAPQSVLDPINYYNNIPPKFVCTGKD